MTERQVWQHAIEHTEVNWETESFVPLRQVLKDVGISRSKVYEMINRGEFPAPIKIHSGSFWLKSHVAAWKQWMFHKTREEGWKSAWKNVPRRRA